MFFRRGYGIVLVEDLLISYPDIIESQWGSFLVVQKRERAKRTLEDSETTVVSWNDCGFAIPLSQYVGSSRQAGAIFGFFAIENL